MSLGKKSGSAGSLFLLIFLQTILQSCITRSDQIECRFIAEWEAKQEIVVGFRTHQMGPEFEYVTLRMIRSLAEDEKISVIVQDSSLMPEGKAYFAKNGCDTTNIVVLYDDPTYFWIRDPGPIFYVDKIGQMGVADFKFGYYLNASLDSIDNSEIPLESYDRDFADRHNMPIISSKLSIEGGGFETNGAGTVILVESVVLNRNPDWNKEQIEMELEEKFGVKTTIWLPEGLAEDPYFMGHLFDDYFAFGTGGHSDEFVRFVNDSTIFLAWEFGDADSTYPFREDNRSRLIKSFSILDSVVDWRGRKFTIEKVPLPVPFYKSDILDTETKDYLNLRYTGANYSVGQSVNLVACASYLNFVITNSKVLIPKYWHYSVPDSQFKKDELVYNLFQRYFPLREIIQINPLVLNYSGGGMHCAIFATPKSE